MIGIYMIKNKLNNKVYIGQSVDVEQRLTQHKHSLENSNISWYREAREESNNIDDFDFSVIQSCKEYELDELEEYWINYYNSFDNGYNKTADGSFTGNHRKLSLSNEGFSFFKNDFFTTINSKQFANILQELSGNEYKVWLYCLKQAHNGDFFLPNELEKFFNISGKTAQRSFKRLIELGYLKEKSKNNYIFYPFK